MARPSRRRVGVCSHPVPVAEKLGLSRPRAARRIFGKGSALARALLHLCAEVYRSSFPYRATATSPEVPEAGRRVGGHRSSLIYELYRAPINGRREAGGPCWWRS